MQAQGFGKGKLSVGVLATWHILAACASGSGFVWRVRLLGIKSTFKLASNVVLGGNETAFLVENQTFP